MRRSLPVAVSLLAALSTACNTPYTEEDEAEDLARCETSTNPDEAPLKCADAEDGVNSVEEPTPEPEPEPEHDPSICASAYRFVLVKDLSHDDPDGPAPGADIDAIGLELADGTQVWAESVEDFEFGGDYNKHFDTLDLLGPPNAPACADREGALTGFTSLGGADRGGYVIVAFGDQTFGSGDTIIVRELGPASCDDAPPDWIDDGLSVHISPSTDAATFVLLGDLGGVDRIVIP